MKILLTLFFATSILIVNAQKVTRKEAVEKKLLTEASNFRIDSVIYYCNPFVTVYFEPIEQDYKPAWLHASLVSKRPDLFDDYANIAPKYSHDSMIKDSTKLEEYKRLSIESLKIIKLSNIGKPLFGYTFGEIWFTELEKNISIVSVLHIYMNDSIPLQFNFFNNPWDKGTGAVFFVWEEGLLKCLGYSLCDLLQLDKYDFWDFKDFQKILSAVPTYKRSFIKNGHRIFETVKNTPNGPVVVKDDSNQAWYLKYWWALAAGAIVFLLLVVALARKKKKQ